MPKFAVKVHGKHYEIEVKKRKFLLLNSSTWNPAGFYTTRFVESESANEAIEKVFEIVKSELKEIARSNEDSALVLSQIQEDEQAYNLYAPGEGFTFYLED